VVALEPIVDEGGARRQARASEGLGAGLRHGDRRRNILFRP
jgi:hypothetical protein